MLCVLFVLLCSNGDPQKLTQLCAKPKATGKWKAQRCQNIDIDDVHQLSNSTAAATPRWQLKPWRAATGTTHRGGGHNSAAAEEQRVVEDSSGVWRQVRAPAAAPAGLGGNSGSTTSPARKSGRLRRHFLSSTAITGLWSFPPPLLRLLSRHTTFCVLLSSAPFDTPGCSSSHRGTGRTEKKPPQRRKIHSTQ
jgi:hypothetical protein